jgi:hypothetical protein
MIVVKKASSEQREGWIKQACEVVHEQLPGELFFRLNSDLSPAAESPSSNAFILGLLWPAMVLGEDLIIEGEVSEELIYVANNDLQALLVAYEPALKRVAVSVEGSLPSSAPRQRSVATGFSAGIDTFTTLKLYSNGGVPGISGIDTLTTFNVGAMGNTTESVALFEKYCKRTIEFAKSTSRSWINVNSNLDDFYNSKNCGFQKTHNIRNLAAAYACESVISDYLYSSTYPYYDINSDNFDMAFIEPMLVALISTQSLNIYSAGASFSRLEKTKFISDYEPSFDLLDICVGHPMERAQSAYPNCSRCWKCARALITFDALGKLSNFSAVFDVEKFLRNRSYAYEEILLGAIEGRPADRDVAEFFKERGKTFPVTRLFRLRCCASKYKKMIKKIIKNKLNIYR